MIGVINMFLCIFIGWCGFNIDGYGFVIVVKEMFGCEFIDLYVIFFGVGGVVCGVVVECF